MFDSIFKLILIMSIAASVIAILIILFRWIFLKNIPRFFTYISARDKANVKFKKFGTLLCSVVCIVLIIFVFIFITTRYGDKSVNSDNDYDKKNDLSISNYAVLERAATEYYAEYQPDVTGKLDILEVEKYDTGYLVLMEKYNREIQDTNSLLLLMDDGFNIKSVVGGNTSYLPLFGTYSVVDGDKYIIYGGVKKEENISKQVSLDLNISEIEITFGDGKSLRGSISAKGGYIIVADVIAEIKDIDLYNIQGKREQFIKAEPLYKICTFTEVKANVEEEYPDNYYLETVVINDCIVKDGPGDHYKSIGTYKYGDIVYVVSKYDGWAKCVEYIEKECVNKWIKISNLIDDKNHYNENYGIVTSDQVTVGKVNAQKGNLLKVLIRDENRSCVYKCLIGINSGKTGWIDNSDYSLPERGIYFNEGILKSGTYSFREPSIKSEKHKVEGAFFVAIGEEKGDWVHFGTFGPIEGWVLKENIYIPPNLIKDEECEGYKVVREYLDALEISDYEKMVTMSTEHLKNNYLNNDVKRMEGSRVRWIVLCAKDKETDSSVVYKAYAQTKDDKPNDFYISVTLIRGEDGILRVDKLIEMKQ